MFSKNLLLVALFVAMLVFISHSEAAPTEPIARTAQWRSKCGRSLVLFTLSVCGDPECSPEVSRLGCQRQLTEDEVRAMCCPF
ncbi:hypothetical protein CAEBREN_08657 [Caenorhabditis brenneri]|uniref:Uncharacterized protein n=1 Tax=Caenorhabditis brenneri TaxID=135651 RepID=G0MJA4_CAEBE|nr:hypothetical protein CAEBREN_08657 [Caenorhabditis brenneri]